MELGGILIKEEKQLNLIMIDLRVSDCTDEEKEIYKKDIERYLKHRKKRIASKKTVK